MAVANIPLTQGDLDIINLAHSEKNPAIFTNYYMAKPDNPGIAVYPGSFKHDRYMAAWLKAGKPNEFHSESVGVTFPVRVEKKDNLLIFREMRGALPLPWALEMFRAPQKERYIIGVQGTGKTYNIGMLAMFMCATIPNFNFYDLAPLQQHSRQMLNTTIDFLRDTLFLKKFVLWHGKNKWYKESPFMVIDFVNGSHAYFFNIERDAENVQSSYGDWYHLDEGGLLYQTDETGAEVLNGIYAGIATRMRASRPDGSPRLEWMTTTSAAYDCESLWDRYEAGLKPNRVSWSRLVLHKDNPYLTQENLNRFQRQAALAGQEAQIMRGERPQPKGSELSEKLVLPMFVDEKLEIARAMVANGEEGWVLDEYADNDVRLYEEPYIPGHTYMMTGDPGTGAAPDRNAPTIMVWDVTNFPEGPAHLVAFYWGDGGGKYEPFISRFEMYAHKYHVAEAFRGYDSTAAQKAIAELSFEAGGMPVQTLGFDGQKKWFYLNALKLILGKQLLKAPSINAIRKQLTRYRIPDTKIAQDIVSTISMGCFLLYPLYRTAYPEVVDATEKANQTAAHASRGFYRSPRSRDTRSRWS